MIELVYPQEIAPVVKGQSAARACEMLPIVDHFGIVLAQAPRNYCHVSEEKPLHPVVHLHIINRSGQIYLQRRSKRKTLFPLRWDTAVGGHISYGEYIHESLYREAEEELKLQDFMPIFIKTYVYESPRERELINVFAAVGDFIPTPDPFELDGGRYWDANEIESSLGKGILTPNFESEYLSIKDSLFALL